jgi:hypothetical protein
MTRPASLWLWVIPALLVATWARTLPLLDNRFHPDEALYATFTRLISSGQGILLSNLVVDKPPLPFYLGAFSNLLVGGSELGMRLPNFYASVITVALTWALAHRLYASPTAYLAAWSLALSPLAILFSITVFIDPLLVAFGTWGLWLTTAGRYRWAAVAFALAFASKQTAMLFIPLALALSLISLPATSTGREMLQRLWQVARPMLLALLLTLGLIILWDIVRQPPIGFWEQGYSDNMPNRFIRANEVLPRAWAWLDLLYHFTATPALNWLVGLSLPLLWLQHWRSPSRAALTDVILLGYLGLFLAAYWLLAFNVWDRYLVLILPLFVLLLARVLVFWSQVLARLFETWNLKFASEGRFRSGAATAPLPPEQHARCPLLPLRHALPMGRAGVGSPSGTATAPLPSTNHLPPASCFLLPVSFLLLILPATLRAAHSGYAIGGDHGAYDGIDEVARFIRALPPEGVLYDHWLSWEFGYYLFDRLLYISWFPTPAALATDLRSFVRTSPRYLVIPSWEAEAEVRAAAAQAGFDFILLHTTTRRDGSLSFSVYQLAPRPP